VQALLDAVGFGLCHQLPERSFFAGGLRVPVCARDTGIYVGFVVALGVLALLHRDRPSGLPPVWVNVLLGAGVFAMAIDGLTSYLGLRVTTNEVRLATGLATGFAICAWVLPLLSDVLWRAPGRGRVLGGSPSVGWYLAALTLTYVGVWWGAPLLGASYPVLVLVAIIATFTVINLVIVCLLPPFERRARRLREAWIPMLLALGLTAVEIGASAALKAGLLSVVA